MDTFVYEYNGKDYINLTNKCTNSCTFCIRNGHDGVGGHELWLKKEPTADEVIELLKENKRDVVFCGFGEPLIKLEEMKKIAEFVKSYGGEVRVNTNGHANAYHGRNIVPEISHLVDVFSISLNHYDSENYEKVCRSIYKEKGFDYMLDFAKECIANNNRVILSALDIIGDEAIEKCRKIACEIGAEFRKRYFE